MALQVWLPLNGNLNNQGSNTSKIVVNSATVDSAGKIGSCYNFSSGNYMGIDGSSTNNFQPTTNATICCWAYFTQQDSNERYVICCFETGGFGICWESQKVKFVLYSNSTYNISYSASTLSLNAWHHIAITYDSGRYMRIYVDGSLSSTKDLGSSYSITYNSTTPWEIGGNPGPGSWASGNLIGKLNDIRMYDECLSDKQVREISKGLAIHYSLSDGYIEPTTNLVGDISNLVLGSPWSASKYPSTGTYVPTQTSDGNIEYLGNGSGIQCYSVCGVRSGLSASTVYTISIRAKVGQGARFVMYFYCKDSSGSSTGTYTKTFTYTDGKDRVYSNTFTTPENTTSYYIELNNNSGDLGSSLILYKNSLQVEQKDHATPWTNSSRATNVADISGFKNHGTISSEPQVLDSSARYDKSTYLDGTDDTICLPFNSVTSDGTFTMNVWIYKTTFGSKSWETIFGGPSGFELQSKRGSTASPVIVAYSWGQSSSGGTAYTLNTWHMVTMVRTSSDAKFYLDGELIYTGSAGSIPSGNYFIGSWSTSTSQNYLGRMSDFRIYTTALSADDIKLLYNAPIEVTSNGSLMTQGEVIEV